MNRDRSSSDGEPEADPAALPAALEGVADRVELHTADMRKLSFDDSFDVVVSSLMIHNVPDAGERAPPAPGRRPAWSPRSSHRSS